MIKHLLFTSFCAVGLHASAWAFDLQDAWNASLQHDARHSAAALQRDIATEQAIQARAPLLPQINVNGQYQRQTPIEPNTDAYNQYGYSIQATQTLFDSGQWADWRQGQVGKQLAAVQFDLSEQQLLLEVSQAYFDVLTAHDLIASSDAAKTVYQRQLEQATTMFDVGAATIVDTHEAQAGLNQAQVQSLQAQHQLQLAQEALQHLTGLNPNDIQKLDAQNIAHIVPTQTLVYWQEQALANNSQLSADALAVEQARIATQKARSHAHPKLELQAAYQDQRQQMAAGALGVNQNRGTSIGVQLRLPLYAGGGISSQMRQAQLELLQRQDQLLASTREIQLQVRERYLNVQNGLAQIKALEQLLLSNQKKLASSQLGQQVGVRSNLDVVMAQQAYADSQQQLAHARYQYLQAQLALSQTAGQLQSAANLAHINQAIAMQTPRKAP